MIEGKKITLAELFARRSAENRADVAAQDAWEQTPEGKAWRTAQDAHHQRMADADAKFAAENPQPEDDGGDDEDEREIDDEE